MEEERDVWTGLMSAVLHNERFRDWMRTDFEAIYCHYCSDAERIAEFIEWIDGYEMDIAYDEDREAWAVYLR